jgi:hypothetical protein
MILDLEEAAPRPVPIPLVPAPTPQCRPRPRVEPAAQPQPELRAPLLWPLVKLIALTFGSLVALALIGVFAFAALQ